MHIFKIVIVGGGGLLFLIFHNYAANIYVMGILYLQWFYQFNNLYYLTFVCIAYVLASIYIEILLINKLKWNI